MHVNLPSRIGLLSAVFCLSVLPASADVSVVECEGFLNGDYRTVFTGVKLADLVSFSGDMLGNYCRVTITNSLGRVQDIPAQAVGCFPRTGLDGTVTVQFQALNSGALKCVYVQFAQVGDDVQARTVKARYSYAKATGADFDVDVGYNQSVASNATQIGYGVCRVAARRAGRDRVSAPGFFDFDERELWNPGSLSMLGDWRGVLTGTFLQTPQHGFEVLTANTGARAQITLQSYSYNVQTPSDSNTRMAAFTFTQDVARVTGHLDDVYYRGGCRLGETTLFSAYSHSLIGTKDTASVAVRDLSAGRLHARILKRPDFITTTPCVYWANASLSDVVAVDGTMGGSYLSGTGVPPTALYKYANDGSQLSVQFHLQYNNDIKGVKLVLEQVGADIVGHAEYAKNKYGTAGVTDLDEGGSSYQVATSYTVPAYGVCNLTLVCIPDATRYRRWTGGAGNNRFAEAGNWSGNVLPQAGDELLFTVPGEYVNDLPAGTLFSNVLFAASSAMRISGNALALVNAENYGSGKAVFACDVSCAGDFEPRVGGGLVFDGALAVTGILAPQQGAVTINGTAQAAALSLGNAGAYARRPADFGYPASVYYQRAGTGSLTANSLGEEDFLVREALMFEGSNTFAKRFRAPNGLLLGVTNGVTSIADVEPGEAVSARLRAFVGGQLHLSTFSNRYNAAVSFEGPGCFSFGSDGLWARPSMTFTDMIFVTAGSDYAITGSLSLAGSIVVDARDPDGTMRTITLAADMVPQADAMLQLTGGRIACAYGTRLEIPTEFAGAELVLPKRTGRMAVLSAPSITGLPTTVTQTDGRACTFSVEDDAGGQTLYAERIPVGCLMIVR